MLKLIFLPEDIYHETYGPLITNATEPATPKIS